MATPIFSVQNTTAFAATAGAKTILNLRAGANQNIAIVEWGISFDGVTSSAVPATVDLCQSTEATAGTSAGALTAVQTVGRTLAWQGTVGHNFTAEPTVLTPFEQVFVPQFMGAFVKQYPLGYEPESDFSGGTIKALSLRVNVSANVNVRAYVKFTVCG